MLFERIAIVDENFDYQEDMYVGISGNLITDISKEAPSDALREHYYQTYDGKGKVLMPGFVNAHGHSPMSLMRGYGENLPLQRWLNELVFPFEDQLDGEAVYNGTLLSMAESIRYGITSTSDMYFWVDDMVRAITTSGAKANIARAVTHFGGDVYQLPSFIEQRDSILMYHGFDEGRILIDASVHAEYTNSDESVKAVVEQCREHDLIMHIHLSETENEVNECIERRGGKTPVEYFDSLGLFDGPVLAAHSVWLTDNDYQILKSKNVTVASNPISNLKLVSGICDVKKLMDNGIRVAIGTDSSTSNNSLDFFEEIKTFALLAKLKSGDPAFMTPKQALYAATRAGALAQGRKTSGLIKEGYRADLIVVDTDVPNMQPSHNMLNNLVYSACGKDVCLTMVDGRVLYQDGEYKTIDIEKVMYDTNAAKDRILAKL